MEKLVLEKDENKYRVYRINNPELPKNSFIISSQESRDILYNPHIAGKTLQDRIDKMSEVFVNAITTIALRGEKKEKIVEFVLLSGALYYNLNYGFKKVHEFALPQCFLGIKRQRVEGTEGNFTAVSTYENFESLVDGAIIVMGDTIASGATLIRAVGDLEKALEEREYKMKKLIVLSLATSTEGGRKLKKLEEKLGVEVYFFAAEQLFHLMPDGTDLRFLMDDSIMPQETKEHTIERFGEILGKKMKCAVFDWGTRCKNPKKHYWEFLEFADEIEDDPELDEKGKHQIKRMKKEIFIELKKLEKTI